MLFVQSSISSWRCAERFLSSCSCLLILSKNKRIRGIVRNHRTGIYNHGYNHLDTSMTMTHFSFSFIVNQRCDQYILLTQKTMGATHSHTTAASCESSSNDGGGPSYEPDSKIPAAAASSVPPGPMPVLARPETFEEKLYRKVSCWKVFTNMHHFVCKIGALCSTPSSYKVMDDMCSFLSSHYIY